MLLMGVVLQRFLCCNNIYMILGWTARHILPGQMNGRRNRPGDGSCLEAGRVWSWFLICRDCSADAGMGPQGRRDHQPRPFNFQSHSSIPPSESCRGCLSLTISCISHVLCAIMRVQLSLLHKDLKMRPCPGVSIFNSSCMQLQPSPY